MLLLLCQIFSAFGVMNANMDVDNHIGYPCYKTTALNNSFRNRSFSSQRKSREGKILMFLLI